MHARSGSLLSLSAALAALAAAGCAGNRDSSEVFDPGEGTGLLFTGWAANGCVCTYDREANLGYPAHSIRLTCWDEAWELDEGIAVVLPAANEKVWVGAEVWAPDNQDFEGGIALVERTQSYDDPREEHPGSVVLTFFIHLLVAREGTPEESRIAKAWFVCNDQRATWNKTAGVEEEGGR